MRPTTHLFDAKLRWLWRLGVALGVVAVTAITVGCQREQREDLPPIEDGETQAETAQLQEVWLQPAQYEGRSVQGQATVTQVVSPRGFFIGEGGNRMLVVIQEERPTGDAVQLQAGQSIKVQGVLYGSDQKEVIAGRLNEKTQKRLENQGYYVMATSNTVEIVEQPEMQAKMQQAREKKLVLGDKEFGSFADYDANENFRLSRGELVQGVEQRQVFADYDMDNTQMLGQTEFDGMLYVIADTNQNKRIEEGEFRVLTSNWKPLSDERGEFREWDENNSGWIGVDEFARKLDDTDFFDDWDRNDNKYINYKEFGTGLFVMWDADRSDFVSVDEFGFEQVAEVSEL